MMRTLRDGRTPFTDYRLERSWRPSQRTYLPPSKTEGDGAAMAKMQERELGHCVLEGGQKMAFPIAPEQATCFYPRRMSPMSRGV